jgi:catechol 2,3-dioxygenase-like lactoylglutathione lyase family enzyme
VAVAWVTTCAADVPPDFAIVLICDTGNALGYGAPQVPIGPLSHLGFSLDSRAEVDAVAARAQAAGVLQQAAGYVNEVVAYICMLRDPDGHSVEFSHGQDFERNAT